MGVDAQMFVRTRYTDVTPGFVQRLAYELACAFGPEKFNVCRPGKFSWMPKGRRALEMIHEYTQYGDTLHPEPGERFIECRLSTRFYGETYPRGDLPTILNVAKWLAERIPQSEVWYGGDSPGRCAEPLTEKRAAELWLHFVNEGWKPYWGYGRAAARVCGFCEQRMWNSGGGSGREFYNCDGCRWSIEVDRDGNVTERSEPGR